MVDLTKINWTVLIAISTAVGSCATFFYTIAFIGTLVYLKREINEMRISTYASAYKTIVDLLQTKEEVTAREYIFNKLSNKPFESWSKKDKQEAEKVCRSYDSVGQMVRHEFLPKEYIVDSWGNSLRRCWPILSPFILSLRKKWNSAEIWDDFEWLANEAYLFQKQLYKTNITRI